MHLNLGLRITIQTTFGISKCIYVVCNELFFLKQIYFQVIWKAFIIVKFHIQRNIFSLLSVLSVT